MVCAKIFHVANYFAVEHLCAWALEMIRKDNETLAAEIEKGAKNNTPIQDCQIAIPEEYFLAVKVTYEMGFDSELRTALFELIPWSRMAVLFLPSFMAGIQKVPEMAVEILSIKMTSLMEEAVGYCDGCHTEAAACKLAFLCVNCQATGW